MRRSRLRRLNDEGMTRMATFLESLKSDAPEPYPSAILSEPATSEAVSATVEVEQRSFPRRFEAADYLYRRFNAAGLDSPERDKGLWAWLALFWFDQLCPRDKHDKRKPGEIARWIPQLDNAQRYYRHLLLGSYLVYTLYSNDIDAAMALLEQPLDKPGDVVEQLGSRPQLVTCPAAIGAATRLYCNPDGGLRRGAGGKGPGSPRRLADILMQFDLTYDLHTLCADDLLDLLPREFRRFMKGLSDGSTKREGQRV